MSCSHFCSIRLLSVNSVEHLIMLYSFPVLHVASVTGCTSGRTRGLCSVARNRVFADSHASIFSKGGAGKELDRGVFCTPDYTVQNRTGCGSACF